MHQKLGRDLHSSLAEGGSKNHYKLRDASSSAGEQELISCSSVEEVNSSNYLLAESLALHGSLAEAFDLYALMASKQSDGYVPLDRLNTLAACLVHQVRKLCGLKKSNSSLQLTAESGLRESDQGMIISNAFLGSIPEVCGIYDKDSSTSEEDSDFNELMCPLCRDILRCPVTTNCGHTFCRQCCETISKCNVCHTRFPRAFLGDIPITLPSASLSSLSSSTATTSSSSGSSSGLRMSSLPQAATASSSINSLALSSPSMLGEHRIAQGYNGLALTATTTTTAVASTTSTATTTWASTSTFSVAAAVAAATLRFKPDVLVRRLVEKWWGADLMAKKINEKASSYIHLNMLDEALKFCNESLENGEYLQLNSI